MAELTKPFPWSPERQEDDPTKAAHSDYFAWKEWLSERMPALDDLGVANRSKLYGLMCALAERTEA